MPSEVTKINQREADLLSGALDPEDLDDEELMRGQVRQPGGGFSRTPPRMIPRQVRDELHRRLLTRGDQLFRQGYLGAVSTLLEISTDLNARDSDRIKAATAIIDRIAPKAIEVIHRAETPVEAMLREALAEQGLVIESTATEIADTGDQHG